LLSEGVLFRAINDALVYSSKLDEKQRKSFDAIDWIFSNENNDIMAKGTFTFNYVCHLLKLDKTKARLYLNWQLDKSKGKISENEFTTFLEMCSDGG